MRLRRPIRSKAADDTGSIGISARDVIALSTARANFSELAEEVKAGAEKIITKNGESTLP